MHDPYGRIAQGRTKLSAGVPAAQLAYADSTVDDVAQSLVQNRDSSIIERARRWRQHLDQCAYMALPGGDILRRPALCVA